MASSRGFTVHSANVLSSIGLTLPEGEVKATNMISPIMDELGVIIGEILGGSFSFASSSLSATIWRFLKTSVPQSNSACTIEIPAPLDERSRKRPGRPFNTYSMGKVTCTSVSSGANPRASVITVTIGRLRSGKTSTGRCIACHVPIIIRIKAAVSTASLWRKANLIIEFSTFVVLSIYIKCKKRKSLSYWRAVENLWD